MIGLYRRPILDYWAEHEETLGAIITDVLYIGEGQPKPAAK
jgi:predicted Zn-dependent protease with MMP-like domain